MAPTLPWKSDSSNITLLNRDSSQKPIWHRHQTPLESTAYGDLNRIISSVQLTCTSKKFTIDVLKTAVRQLRFDHPAIATEHAWAGPGRTVFAYEVLQSDVEVDAWLDGVVLDAGSSSASGLAAAIEALTTELVKPKTEYRPVFLVYHIPGDGEHGLVFFFSHSVFDATGCFQLMDLCLSRIADALEGGGRKALAWGEETGRLPTAFLDAARISSTAERTSEDEEMVKRIKEVVDSLPTAHTLPTPFPHPAASPPGVFSHAIPAAQLSALLAAARAHGCTIFSLLMAVMSIATVRLRPPVNSSRVNIPYLFSPVDARPLTCTDAYDRNEWKVRISMGFNSYVTRDLGRFVSEGEEDVWTLAREVRAQTEVHKRHYERMAVWWTDVLTTISKGPEKQAEVPPPTEWLPILSSIGVVDKYLSQSYGPLSVSEPRLRPAYSAPSSAGAGWVALHCFTWDGRMEMAWSFPEGAMGSAAQQRAALQQGKEGEAVALRYVQECTRLLDRLAR